jgi:cell division protein FtsW
VRSLSYTSGDDMQRSARWVMVSMLALCGVGIVMVASASSVQEMERGQTLVMLRSHLSKVALAIGAFLLASRVRPHWLYRAARPAWVMSLVLLAAVLMVGFTAKGAQRWLDLGLTTFQPSEFARVAVIVAIGAWAASRRESMHGFKVGVLAPFALAGIPGVLVLLEPDFGSTIFLLFVGVLVMWVGGAQPKHLVGSFLGVVAVTSFYGWERFAHVSRRFQGFLEPEPGGQVWQSLTALGRGHLSGVGLGSGLGKWGYVPEAENDFILSVIGEELGLLGVLLVIALYGLLLWHGVRLLLGMRTRFAVIVGSGLLFQVVVQALLNIAVVTAVAPPKGLPLPFVSAGGTSLLMLGFSLGLLLGLAQWPEEDPVGDVRSARTGSRAGVFGT